MKPRIKVALCIGTMGIGGAERVVVELLKHFDRERFECHLITLLPNPEKNFLNDIPGDVVLHPFEFNGFYDLSAWWRLRIALSRIKPDVVVPHMFFSNTVLRVLKPFVGYKVISCEHNTEVYKTLKHKMVDKWLAHLTYKIVAVSNTVATFTAKQEGIPIEKFEVIHNGIDTEQIRQTLEALPPKDVLKQELGFELSDKILLNVARLTKQKNHNLLFEGFALFHQKHPEYKLAIVGQGDLLAELETKARELGLSGVVTFFGLRRDVEKFYKMSDAFASASDFEGLSMAYLEAMASGLPLVSTKTAGTDELVNDGKNGFLIQESSAEAVSEGLEKITQTNAEERGRDAIERSLAFDVHNSVKQYEKLIIASTS